MGHEFVKIGKLSVTLSPILHFPRSFAVSLLSDPPPRLVFPRIFTAKDKRISGIENVDGLRVDIPAHDFFYIVPRDATYAYARIYQSFEFHRGWTSRRDRKEKNRVFLASRYLDSSIEYVNGDLSAKYRGVRRY